MKKNTHNVLLLGLLTVVLTIVGCNSPKSTILNNVSDQNSVNVVPSIQNLEELQNSFRNVVKETLSAVVRIDVVEVSTQTIPDSNTNPFFEFFFGNPDEDQSPREFRNEGLGSGVIVGRDGNKVYVLTNAHVIGEAEEIQVTLDDEREYTAELVGRDTRKDLALVSFDTAEIDILVAKLGDSSSLQVGDWVLAMGSPFGFQSTVTSGIVSALHRTGGPAGNISDFIQTDAAINRGNSGGALVNLSGEVVGINTWITTQTGGSVGLGFAIPINNAKKAINDFINNGVVQYGWIGVSITSISTEMQEELGLSNQRGALVNSVYKTSPAGRAGLLPGDFITGVNSWEIKSSDELVLRVGDLEVNEQATFHIIREGQEQAVEVTITTRESEEEIAGQSKDLWPGFSVFPLTSELRENSELPPSTQGVIVNSVVRRSPGAIAGIQTGDIINGVNSMDVSDLSSFYKALNVKLSGEIDFKFIRDGVELKVSIIN
jgi:Do/DeqQ family serine protease